MLSQQQNPPAVLHSLQQQVESKERNPGKDNKAFSIRQYALASRQKGVFNSWPFAEKYLQICLNRGVQDVLPPFELHTSPNESVKGCSNLNCFQDDKNVDFCKNEVSDIIEQKQNIKNEFVLNTNEDGSQKPTSQHCPLSHEEESLSNINVSSRLPTKSDTCTIQSPSYVHRSSNQMKTSSKKMIDKRRRRRGRCKKRSMVDVLAVAKPRSLEDLYQDNNMSYYEPANEGCHQMVPLMNNSQPELNDEGMRGEEERGYPEAANVDMMEKRKWIVKIKLHGCKSDP